MNTIWSQKCAAIALSMLLGPAVQAEEQLPQPVPQTRANFLRCIQDVISSSFPSDFLVEETTVIPDGVLVASVLEFKQDSRLVFSFDSTNVRHNSQSSCPINSIYVVAEKISIGGDGATVEWVAPRLGSPFDRGAAPSGAPGPGFGTDGEPGADGVTGNPGFSGMSAPAVFIVVQDVVGGSRLTLNFSGQDGGDGGQGQTGGRGGGGAVGAPGREALFRCSRQAGRGGDGGVGGDGGDGGMGGPGGDGGTIVLITPKGKELADHFQVIVNGGDGGNGGPPGNYGEGGLPGVSGKTSGLCFSASAQKGNRGENGTMGDQGPQGEPGNIGDYYVYPIDIEQYQTLFVDPQFGRSGQ